jgi:hypothetical protein
VERVGFAEVEDGVLRHKAGVAPGGELGHTRAASQGPASATAPGLRHTAIAVVTPPGPKDAGRFVTLHAPRLPAQASEMAIHPRYPTLNRHSHAELTRDRPEKSFIFRLHP